MVNTEFMTATDPSEVQAAVRSYRVQEGFLFATNVSNRVMGDVQEKIDPPLPGSMYTSGLGILRHNLPHINLGIAKENPSGTALYAVAHELRQPLEDIRGTYGTVKRRLFNKKYHVTKEDMEHSRPGFADGGLSNLEFTWHFAPAIADTAAQALEQQGYLSPEARTNMNLHDWANMIGSGWFGRLMHVMPYTVFGSFVDIGKDHGHFGKNAAAKQLSRTILRQYGDTDASKLFTAQEMYEEADGHTYLGVTATQTLKDGLRERLLNGNGQPTTGCPVARKTTVVSADLLKSSHHAKSLLKRGEIEIVSTEDNKARTSQEYTAIDIALMSLATKLDRYAGAYGTPQVSAQSSKGNRARITHEYATPTGAIRYKQAAG